MAVGIYLIQLFRDRDKRTQGRGKRVYESVQDAFRLRLIHLRPRALKFLVPDYIRHGNR